MRTPLFTLIFCGLPLLPLTGCGNTPIACSDRALLQTVRMAFLQNGLQLSEKSQYFDLASQHIHVRLSDISQQTHSTNATECSAKLGVTLSPELKSHLAEIPSSAELLERKIPPTLHAAINTQHLNEDDAETLLVAGVLPVAMQQEQYGPHFSGFETQAHYTVITPTGEHPQSQVIVGFDSRLHLLPLMVTAELIGNHKRKTFWLEEFLNEH